MADHSPKGDLWSEKGKFGFISGVVYPGSGVMRGGGQQLAKGKVCLWPPCDGHLSSTFLLSLNHLPGVPVPLLTVSHLYRAPGPHCTPGSAQQLTFLPGSCTMAPFLQQQGEEGAANVGLEPQAAGDLGQVTFANLCYL